MNDVIKKWINDNLVYSRGLISKKCIKEWFNKHNYIDQYNLILTITSYLNDINPTFPQRIWHILKDIPHKNKCGNPKCNNPTTFIVFTKGYLRSCCPTCAQHNPQTIEKIKSTNLKKYGVEYALASKEVIEKKKQTCLKHYGVDNPTKSQVVLDKIKANNMEKYGIEWILCDQEKKEKAVFEKYGVKNVQQDKSIKEKTATTHKSMFFDTLYNTNRLNGLVIPLFSKEEYIDGGYYKDYKFKCNKCNTIFLDCLEDGDIPRCPKCFKTISIFESEIFEYTKSLIGEDNIIKKNKKILIGNRELDIYIPSKSLAIECDGLFWHGEFNGNKDKNYHLSKTIECEKKNIKLIHIFDDEWNTKKEIVKSKIKHLLGLNNSKKIYARECKIREISSLEKKIFLNENHVQGNDVSSISYGLFCNCELVSVMTFCKKRVFMNLKKDMLNEYELSRFASIKDYNVIGGAGKLLSYFIKLYKPKKIISYADRRWSVGNLYEKIGFKKINDGNPNYWYFSYGKNYKRFHRFGFAKHTLQKRLNNFDPNLTEWENMKNNGWDRIWDCGSFKYEMTF
jgi:hypothetical protein